jgi:uncharacterized protein (TIGR01244 family)
MSQSTLPLLLCALLATPCGAANPLSSTLLTVTDTVTLAGKLAPDAAAQLRGTNTVVIDLRTPAEGTADESHAMWRNGVTYINLPTTGQAPARSEIELFDAIVAVNSRRPILVHCASGNRAGMLWAAHLLDAGASLTSAKEAVAKVATKAPIQAAIDGYAASLQTSD